MSQASSASASGQGSVIRKNQCFAAGGIIEGKGQITRKDGTVVEFNLVSDPLTEAQANSLNKAED